MRIEEKCNDERGGKKTVVGRAGDDEASKVQHKRGGKKSNDVYEKGSVKQKKEENADENVENFPDRKKEI